MLLLILTQERGSPKMYLCDTERVDRALLSQDCRLPPGERPLVRGNQTYIDIM